MRVGHLEFYHQVWGMTPEQKWNEDTDTYSTVWEQHDLGSFSTKDEARQASDTWRGSVAGLYAKP